MKTLWRLISLIVFLAPFAALAMWGGSYFLSCLLYLSAPGEALTLPLQTEGGRITIQTGPYTVDPVAGVVNATDVRVLDDQGKTLAKAKTIRVMAPGPLDLKHSSVQVDVDALEATLERDVRGAWAFQKYFPSKPPEQNPIPLRVNLRSARVRVIDGYGGTTFDTWIACPTLRFASANNAWTADGDVQLLGGTASVFASFTSDQRLLAHGVLRQVEVSQAWAHVIQWPEARDWGEGRRLSARSARVSGPIEASWSDKLGLRLEAEPQARIIGLQTSFWSRPIDADLSGWTNRRMMIGTLVAHDGNMNAAFRGSMAWIDGFSALGKLDASASSLEAIPAQYRKTFPAGLQANGISWSGAIQLRNAEPPTLSGTARIARLVWGRETLSDAVGQLASDAQRTTLRVDSARWMDANLSGAAQWTPSSDALTGFITTQNVALGPLAARYSNQKLGGSGAVRLALSGSLKRPQIDARTNGSIIAQVGGQTRRGLFQAIATWKDDQVSIDRALIASGPAALVGSGSVDPSTHRLNLQLRAAGVEIGEWFEDLGGLATATLRVSGTWDRPVATGRAEILDGRFQGQSAPIVVSDLRLRGTTLAFENVSAARGASRLDGAVTLDWNTRKLAGRLKGDGLQLGDFLGEGFSGAVNLRETRLGGTLDEPEITGQFDASDLSIQGVKIDRFQASAEMKRQKAFVRDARLTIGEGVWNGQARYDVTSKSGSVSGVGRNFDLQSINPLLPTDFALRGAIDLSTNASWRSSGLTAVQTKGKVHDFRVNPTAFGSGSFDIEMQGPKWTASVDLGQPERFVQAQNLTYNTESKAIGGEVTAFALPIRDLVAAIPASVYPTDSGQPNGLRQTLATLEGSASINVDLAGKLDDPVVAFSGVELNQLAIDGSAAGRVLMEGSRGAGGIWTLRQLSWIDGPGALSATGRIDEHGAATIEGDLNNFKPSWLAIFDSRFANVSGFANVHFNTDGPTRQPRIVASLDAFLFEQPAAKGASPTYGLTANVGPIILDASGIQFEGDFSARGVRGGALGRIPFEYPFSIPTNQALDIDVSVPRRLKQADGSMTQESLDLTQFDKEVQVLRFGSGERTLRANVHVGGSINDPEITGQALAQVDTIGYGSIDTELRKVRAEATLERDQVSVSVKGGSNFVSKAGPGSIDATVAISIPDLIDRLSSDGANLWDAQLKGRATIRNFRIKEIDPASGGAGDVVVNAWLKMSGPLREPLISTVLPATFEGLTATMPTQFPAAAPGQTPTFNPRFSIGYVVGSKSKPANMRAVTANFDVHGAGALSGTLSELVASANLTVDKGSIRLPNARVAIQENGTTRFLYRGRESGTSDIRLDVDLQGRTSLSAVRPGGSVQRYDIELLMRGNLLDESNQFIQARSDPPDLDQAVILNMLGQRDLFEGLANQFVGERSNRALAQTLAGVAIPVVFDPFTERIAQELGLEYLQLEYNAFEGATVTAAKSLGNGFMLQGRRQIQENNFGVLNYDFRLTYRPPTRFKKLRNVVFAAGTDQDRPWKISVEYGIRF